MTTLYDNTTGKSLSIVPTDDFATILNDYEKLYSILNSLIITSPDRSSETTRRNIELIHSSYGYNAVRSIRDTLDIVKDVCGSSFGFSNTYTYSPENSILSTIKIVNKNIVVMPIYTLQTLTNHNTTLSSKIASLIDGVDYPLQKFTVMKHTPYFIHHSQNEGAGNGGTFYYIYTGSTADNGDRVFYDLKSKTTVTINNLALQELTGVTIDCINNIRTLTNLARYFADEHSTEPTAQALLKTCKYTLRDIFVNNAIIQNNTFVSGRVAPHCNDPLRKTLYYTIKEEQKQYVTTNFRVHKSSFTNLSVDPSLVPKTDDYALEDTYIDTYLEHLCNPKSTN